MKKPATLLTALVLGSAVAACDRSITASEGGHTVGSGNMKSAAAPASDAGSLYWRHAGAEVLLAAVIRFHAPVQGEKQAGA